MNKTIHFPTVDDWWSLTKEYPSFRRASNTSLKDFGYMAVLRHIKESGDIRRILEFGHGFNGTLFETFKNAPEMEIWGIDDYQALHYYPPKEEWEKKYNYELFNKYPGTKFIRGLLGDPKKLEGKLPYEYFDLIFSVSVLEEIGIDSVTRILAHCRRLLRPGGVLMSTQDICFAKWSRAKEFVEAHRQAGFGFELTQEEKNAVADCNSIEWKSLLIENPTVCMAFYQGNEKEGRRYAGHWTTQLMKVIK